MKSKLLYTSVFSLISLPVFAYADNVKDKDLIVITAAKPALPTANIIEENHIKTDGARDAGALIENEKGVAIIRNGSQTGIVQLRGLSQDRVKIKLDGIEINPACPSHMDPPLHYVGTSQIDAISIVNGITSVADGGDSIAGTIIINTRSPKFSSNGKAEFSGELDAAYFNANDGYDGTLALNLGLDNAAFRLSGSVQNGDDLKYHGGTASVTGYNARRYNFDAEFITPIGQIGFGAGLHESRNIGTPSLAMDMVYDNSTSLRFGLIGNYGMGQLNARLFHNDIDHIMDNYTIRQYTAAASRMKAPANSIDDGYAISYKMPFDAFTLNIGSDGRMNDFNVYGIMANGMVSQSFVNSKRNRIGFFGEVEGNINQHLMAKAGIRYDNITAETDKIAKYMAMDTAIINAFNASDRKKEFDNFEYSAAIRWHINNGFILNLSAAQKMRAPSLVELYTFKPSATYGAADGRNYQGNLDLNAETSRQISASANIKLGNLKITPDIFYNKIDDYIQGVAINNIANATLKYSNIDAEIYGAEIALDYSINDKLSAFASASYARGKDMTHNDNLYRLAPLRAIVGLNYTINKLEAQLEGKLVAKQNKVSAYNNEQQTPSYQIYNIRGRYNMNDDFGINFGVENIGDKYYYDHLSGINRADNIAMGGDLAMGVKVPGAGRSYYLGVNYKF